MHRRIWTIIALLAFAFALMPAFPASAGYGAMAWDKETGKRGWSWNQSTAEKAKEVALSECGASGCRVIIRTTAKQCAAMASTEDGKFIGAAARGTQSAARVAALTNCQKGKAGDCTVRVSDCNK